MRRLGRRTRSSDPQPEINVAPLLDVVFILLIFFVVTTAFVARSGVDVQRPSAVTARELSSRALLVAVTREGTFVHAGERLDRGDLRALVARESTGKPRPVILVVDEAAPSGRLVEAVDACRLGGAESVSIAARKEEP